MCDVHRQGRRNCRENAPKRSNVIDRCLLPTPDLMGATCASRLLLCMLQSMLKNSTCEAVQVRLTSFVLYMSLARWIELMHAKGSCGMTFVLRGGSSKSAALVSRTRCKEESEFETRRSRSTSRPLDFESDPCYSGRASCIQAATKDD